MGEIKEKILAALRLYNKGMRLKTLQTLEEIEANTGKHYIAGAEAVNELNNKLGGFEPVLNSKGEITGYKTHVGGADTVFPFSAKRDIVLAMSQGTLQSNSALTYYSDKAPCDGTITYTLHQSSIQAYAWKNGVVFASLPTYNANVGYSIKGTLSVKRGDVISISAGERLGHSNSVLFVGRYQ